MEEKQFKEIAKAKRWIQRKFRAMRGEDPELNSKTALKVAKQEVRENKPVPKGAAKKVAMERAKVRENKVI